jgi:hypothetical protein
VRPALESREEVEKARWRRPALHRPLLVDEAKHAVLPEDWSKEPPPQWVRLLANFPATVAGGSSACGRTRRAIWKPVLKAQVSWIIARQDRAWYAVGRAKARLKELGLSDDEIYKLDGDWKSYTPAERSLFTVARKLAASPVVLTDADVNEALKQTGPREVVQLSYTTGRALSTAHGGRGLSSNEVVRADRQETPSPAYADCEAVRKQRQGDRMLQPLRSPRTRPRGQAYAPTLDVLRPCGGFRLTRATPAAVRPSGAEGGGNVAP